jgi:hypothetical protein
MRLRVRECLAAYAIQDLRLAVDTSRQAPPDYQLLVSNAAKHPPLFAEKGNPAYRTSGPAPGQPSTSGKRFCSRDGPPYIRFPICTTRSLPS